MIINKLSILLVLLFLSIIKSSSILNDDNNQIIFKEEKNYPESIYLYDPQRLLSAKEYEDFLIGFAMGLELKLSSDSEECFLKAQTTFQNFETGFKLIDNGFNNRVVSDISIGIQDLGIALQDIPNVFEKCGIDQFMNEISVISEELGSGTFGLIKFLIRETITIWKSQHNLTSDFKDAISAWKIRDYKTCGYNVGEIVGILLE